YTLPTIWACSGLAPVRARPWRANMKKAPSIYTVCYIKFIFNYSN
ncbi:hypothetical protein GPL02_00235, partial [Clostridium sp. MCC334]|nr:hypothetical protein [Clostridium sp. MCC334]